MIIKVTKCTGEGCPLKEKCYRYLSRNEKEETYKTPPFSEVKEKIKEGINQKCKYFLLNEEWNFL